MTTINCIEQTCILFPCPLIKERLCKNKKEFFKDLEKGLKLEQNSTKS